VLVVPLPKTEVRIENIIALKTRTATALATVPHKFPKIFIHD
jgi:hypothetical protein